MEVKEGLVMLNLKTSAEWNSFVYEPPTRQTILATKKKKMEGIDQRDHVSIVNFIVKCHLRLVKTIMRCLFLLTIGYHARNRIMMGMNSYISF